MSIGKKTSIVLTAIVALGMLGDRAGAAYITFTDTVSATAVSGIASVNNGASSSVLTTPNGTPITLMVNSGGTAANPIDTASGTNIILGNITVGVNNGTPQQGIRFNFTYTVTVTDYASIGGPVIGTGTFTVNGTLGGTIGAGTAVTLNNLTAYSPTPTTLRIGNDFFSIATLGTGLTGAYYVPPGASSNGSFGAQIMGVPEPSSLALLGLGGLTLAATRLRRPARRGA